MIAVDSFLPVINPLTGKTMGEVKVLLAMGSQEQVMSLQTLKVIATVSQLEQRQEQQTMRSNMWVKLKLKHRLIMWDAYFADVKTPISAEQTWGLYFT